MHVLKIGGNELQDAAFVAALAAAVAAHTGPLVLVHGGGREIASLQSRLGLPTVMIDGIRVTDSESLAVAQMVLCGEVNKRLVAALLTAGVVAVGLSGVDGGLLRCMKREHPTVDLGYVGRVAQVDTRLPLALLEQGMTPVVAPISLGLDSQTYNVNADEAAGAIAAALNADLLTFLSNVPAVLDRQGQPIAALSPAETERLIEHGIIDGGMVPKVRTALAAITQGVPRARIVNLEGFGNGGGTIFNRGSQGTS